MPSSMALIGITVLTMQILNDQLHKADDKNKTLNGKSSVQFISRSVQSEFSSVQFISFDTYRLYAPPLSFV